MNYENIQLKGVTRKPDDSLSPDGELAIALDLVHDGDGLRTGEQPTQLFSTEDKSVIFIHQNAGYKHYISYAIANNVTTLYYRVGTSGTDTAIHTLTGGITAISSVGNTIIVNDGTGLNYILWDASQQTYRFLGQKPPFPRIRFGLQSEMCRWPEGSTIPKFETTVDERVVPVADWKDNNYWLQPYPEMSSGEQQTFINNGIGNFSFENKIGTEGDGPVLSVIEDITQWAMSYVNEFVNKHGAEQNRFIYPFFVRYAYELYDGTSYIMHSAPILMIPNSKGPIFGLYDAAGTTSHDSDNNKNYAGFKLNDNDNHQFNFLFRGRVYGFASKLVYMADATSAEIQEMNNWKDIIKGISIFATPQSYAVDQEGKVYGWRNMDDEHAYDEYFSIASLAPRHDGNPVNLVTNEYKAQMFKDVFSVDSRINTPSDISGSGNKDFFLAYSESYKYPSYVMKLPTRDIEDMKKLISNNAQFFKLCTIPVEDLVASSADDVLFVDVEMEKHTVKTLTSQKQLPNDYYSHDTLSSSVLYPYNRRLNLGGVERHIASPTPCYTQWMHRFKYNTQENLNHHRQWQMAVFSRINGKESISFNSQGSLSFDGEFPHYIFVPDPDAYKVMLRYNVGSSQGATFEVELEKHPYLNGAYWLGDVFNPYDNIYDNSNPDVSNLITTDAFPSSSVNLDVELHNLVYTSEAENPFVFAPENVNALGDGRILALCSNTTMLSHDVFGREPMYVFTEQGVWPMTVGTTGVFSSVQMPNVRDVILPGTKPLPITQGILFLTRRGLLAMNGNSVKVVSEDINNDLYAEFDKLTELVSAIFNADYAAKVNVFSDFRNDSSNARLAYDYRNQRVYVALGNGCWVLNLKSTLWTQSSTVIGTPLNSFPDCEFATDNSVYTIESARKDAGLLLTRPVKTGSEFYANIKEMAARGNFSINDAPVVTALFGTRNFINNYLLKSSTRPRITRFGGSPFKAHSFLAAIKNPSALVNMADKTYIDRFVIGIDTFQRNKLR